MALAPPFEQLFEGTQEGNGCPSAVAAQGRGEGQGRGGLCHRCAWPCRDPHSHTHTSCGHGPSETGFHRRMSLLCARHAIPGAGRPLPLGLLPPVPTGMSESTLVAGNVLMFCPSWGITCQCGLVSRCEVLLVTF